MIGIGPFSAEVVLVVLAALIAWFTVRILAARRLAPEFRSGAASTIFDALFWGLLAARLAYVSQWWRDYVATPMSIVSIGDGGFNWWVGAFVGLCWICWRHRAHPLIRNAVLTGALTGLAAWFGAGVLLDRVDHAAPEMPDMELTKLDAQRTTLSAYRGQPVVVNLWATWCPPCRREMPAFVEAEKAYNGVRFIMINQGETAQQVSSFLQRQNLPLSDVLLDSTSGAMKTLGARALPTTFFFDAQGHLVHSHMGELTLAGIKGILSRQLDVPAP